MASMKAPEIAVLMCEYLIHIVVFQETKLNYKNRTPSLEGGVLITAIHNSSLRLT